MSAAVMCDAWELSQTRGDDLVILLALADITNQDLEARPSDGFLESRSRMSSKGVEESLHRLFELGEVRPVYRDGEFIIEMAIARVPVQ